MFFFGTGALLLTSVMAIGQQTTYSPSSEQTSHTDFGVMTYSNKPIGINSGQQLDTKKSIWEKVLVQIAQRENTSLFFDLSLNASPPRIDYKQPHGSMAMQLLAQVTNRTWKQMDGVQVFSRGMPEGTSNLDNTLQLIEWVKSLPLDKRKSLLIGWLKLEDLDPEARDRIIRIAIGINPGRAFSFLDKDASFGFQLEFSPKIEYISPKNGDKYFVILRDDKPDNQVPAFRNTFDLATEALKKPEIGSLDFGNGEILPTREILNRAYSAFHQRYIVDGRIAEALYFISGTFTQQSFESTLQLVMNVPGIRSEVIEKDETVGARRKVAVEDLFQELFHNEWKELRGQNIDTSYLRRQNMMRGLGIGAKDAAEIKQQQEIREDELALVNKKYGDVEELPVKDFLERKAMTVEQLTKDRPGLAAELTYRGLNPSSTVTLAPSLVLTINNGDVQHFGLM